MYNNEKEQHLDEYQDNGDRYILLLLPLEKESNRPTNLGKETKSLNHLICIPKLPHQVIVNFAFGFANGEGLKA